MLWTTSLPESLLFALLIPLAAVPVAADTYDMVKEYHGSTFFDEWTFYNHFDNLTNGDVIFVSADEAKSSKLAYVDSTTNHAIMQVDNSSTVVYNDKRNSVRLQTDVRYSVGSVWIADMIHVPFGCSVWPAWWSNAPEWPTGGEIDTFEGVNMVTHNQMGLHTLPGCTVTGETQTSTLINSTDCSYLDNSNQGCITTNPSTASYGEAFAQAGGGVFVTEFATTGISVWFFQRADIPSVISSNSSTIDTSTLGTPVGNWPSTTCSSSEFFEAQNLIFDITLCGDFAGATSVFSQTCTGVCYQDYVVGDGANYDNAYFEVASVRVFSKQGTNTIVSTSSAIASTPLSSMLSIGLSLVAAVVTALMAL